MAEEYVRACGSKVEEVMTRDPATIGEEDSLETAVELMERRGVKRLPVVGHDGKMIGIVSRANLLHALVSLARKDESLADDDASIRQRILHAFANQAWAPEVNVVVKDCVVDLWGTITDERERQASIVVAENAAGVRRVHDHLVWVEPTSGIALPSPEDAEKSSMPIATFTAIA
jgi:CBS-domain-containing membrane protein